MLLGHIVADRLSPHGPLATVACDFIAGTLNTTITSRILNMCAPCIHTSPLHHPVLIYPCALASSSPCAHALDSPCVAGRAEGCRRWRVPLR